MIFNTPLFYLFFLFFVFFYGFVFLRQKPKIYFLLVSSLIFYGAWNYRFIPLLVGSAVADYFIAQAIERATTISSKKRFLGLSVAINLGILGLFKYADFVLSSAADLLSFLGAEVDLPTLALVLPVGISFYTFQSMSYTIDVYRGEMAARKGLVEFTAALSFFPQLVAGPILRAKQILPQMHDIPVPTWDGAKHGLLLVTTGVLKKTTADLLAIPAAKVFEADGPVSLMETWTGVLAFAGQIYGDFSGYTDMAIGLALLLGFQIPLNFRVPYFATSPVDFWRRWHISLSSWLRDYLYFSLGGNRNKRRFRNVMVTMLLGGLWHGAAWTFVLWGAFHGALITASHTLGSWSALARIHQSESRWIKLGQWLLTFYLVLIGWVLFRATSMESAWAVLVNMHSFAGGLPVPGVKASTILLLTLATVGLIHVMDYYVLKSAHKLEKRTWLLAILLIIGQALCLFIGKPSNEFIYFQF